MTAESPLISSSASGPLGVLHLPRLWLKILLHACDRLPEGYRHGEGGFDEKLFVNLGVNGKDFIDYIVREKPDYVTLERWVRTHATKLNAEAIAAHNAMVMNAALPEERATQRRAELGLSDASLTNAVELNDLEDWAGAHARLAGRV